MIKSGKQILYLTLLKVKKGWIKGKSMRCVCGDPIEKNLLDEKHYSSSNKLHKIVPAYWCLASAVAYVSDDAGGWFKNEGYNQAIDALCKALSNRMKKRANFDDLVSWNDDETRNKEDVISLIEEARELA